MKRVLIAGLLGAVTIFLWNAISWIALPWHNATMKSVPNDDIVTETLRANVPATGVYAIPGYDEAAEDKDAATKAWAEKAKRGPVGLLIYQAEGMAEPTNYLPAMLQGFFFNLISALIIAYLLSLAGSNLPGFGQRVLFVALIGLFSGIVSHVAPGCGWGTPGSTRW